MVDMSHDVDTDSAARSARGVPREIRIGARRFRLIPVAIALLAVVGVVMIASYDGRSKTRRVSDCLTARGYVLQVVHDDGKEPIGGDEGLLGPLGDYQARPPSDTISVGLAGRDYAHAVATITVQRGAAQVSVLDAKRAQTIRDCAG
jgi:hypothetical protein